MGRFIRYGRAYGRFFIFAPILTMADTLAEVVLPMLMSIIVSKGIMNEDIPFILQMGGVMVLVALFAMGTAIAGAWCSARASTGLGANLRQGLFDKVQEFSFANIDTFSTGSLVTRLTNDITQVQNVTMMGLRMALRAPVMLIGAVVMAVSLDKELAMVFLISIPVLGIALALIMKNAFPRFDQLQRMFDRLNNNVEENATNVRVVKSFVREDYEKEKFEQSNSLLYKAAWRAIRLVVMDMPVMTLVMNITTIAVVWLGGNKILAGQLEVANLMAFITYTFQILMSLMMMSMVFIMGSRAVISARRILEVFSEPVDLKSSEQSAAHNYQVQTGRVEFKNVSFRYSKNGEDVLKNVSFQIDPGQTVAIIGATGSAKTSLVQLIPRLYDVTGGEVLVDGRNVKEYTVEHLRDAVGMVLQKNVLFTGTVKENLKWGDENASDEAVAAAARAAQAHAFIMEMKDGYDTDLSQGGVNVSGGQKQRLCIARALLKKPKILILDDSTSAVDTATEAKIRETFSTTLKEATKIIIAQRITSVMEADKIIIIDDGQIVGMGTHRELLEHNKEYQEIYDSQKDREVSA